MAKDLIKKINEKKTRAEAKEAEQPSSLPALSSTMLEVQTVDETAEEEPLDSQRIEHPETPSVPLPIDMQLEEGLVPRPAFPLQEDSEDDDDD